MFDAFCLVDHFSQLAGLALTIVNIASSAPLSGGIFICGPTQGKEVFCGSCKRCFVAVVVQSSDAVFTATI